MRIRCIGRTKVRSINGGQHFGDVPDGLEGELASRSEKVCRRDELSVDDDARYRVARQAFCIDRGGPGSWVRYVSALRIRSSCINHVEA